MRVLQIHVPYRNAGGEDTAVRDEAAQLRAAGHDVMQLSAPNPEGAVATVGTLALAPWNPIAARRLRALVHRHRPDVAHLHNTWFRLSPAAPAALHALGVPVVMTLHNYRLLCLNAQLLRNGRVCEDCVGRVPWRGVVHRCYRGSAPISGIAAATLLAGRARHVWHDDVDRYIAPSAFVAAKVAEGGVPAARISIKPHGVADPGPRETEPSAAAVVLFVGRLSPEKGIAELVEAWERRPPRGLELLIVGDGPLRRPLEARKVPGVRFAGWQGPAEVRQLMLGARALAFPSLWYEGAPYVVSEALAAGLPVVATGLGSIGDVLDRLGPAWAATRPRQGNWTEALAALEDGELVDEAGRRARRIFERELTFAQSTAGLEAVYETAIAGSPAGPAPSSST